MSLSGSLDSVPSVNHQQQDLRAELQKWLEVRGADRGRSSGALGCPGCKMGTTHPNVVNVQSATPKGPGE